MGIRMNSNSVEWVCLRIPETGKAEFDWSALPDDFRVRPASYWSDCLTEVSIRPVVPSAVPQEVWRRGNEPSKSPLTMYPVTEEPAVIPVNSKVALEAVRLQGNSQHQAIRASVL